MKLKIFGVVVVRRVYCCLFDSTKLERIAVLFPLAILLLFVVFTVSRCLLLQTGGFWKPETRQLFANAEGEGASIEG